MNLVPTSYDTQKIEMIRAQMPVVTREVYLNTGTNGPLTNRAFEAITNHARVELQEGRIGQPAYDRYTATTNELRALVAELLACETDEVALTHNTTEGMNIALLGLDWREGDELITGNSEHEGGLNPAALLKARYGVKVIYTDIGLCNCDPVFSLRVALSKRTKAVVLSHVSWSTGAVLPIRELSNMAHRFGAMVICDAAQSAGMVPSRVYELGVDAYALPGQKWLCGPDGVGALFIRREHLSKIQNTFIGYWGLKQRVISNESEIQFVETAQRFHYAASYPASLAGFNAGLKWMRDEIGWEWIYARTRELGQFAYEELSKLERVKLYMPRNEIAGLVHFTMEGIAPADVTAKLYAQNIFIRHVPEPELNRISTGFFNTEEDILILCDALKNL